MGTLCYVIFLISELHIFILSNPQNPLHLTQILVLLNLTLVYRKFPFHSNYDEIVRTLCISYSAFPLISVLLGFNCFVPITMLTVIKHSPRQKQN